MEPRDTQNVLQYLGGGLWDFYFKTCCEEQKKKANKRKKIEQKGSFKKMAKLVQQTKSKIKLKLLRST